MRTWNDYKEHVREVDPIAANDINEIENIASIVGALIEQRTALGISQRELASLCGIPQSSVARIESYKSTPNLDTLLKIMQPLGLSLLYHQLNNHFLKHINKYWCVLLCCLKYNNTPYGHKHFLLSAVTNCSVECHYRCNRTVYSFGTVF